MSKPRWWWSRTRRLEWRFEQLEDYKRGLDGVFGNLYMLHHKAADNFGTVARNEQAIVDLLGRIVATLYPTTAKDDVPISH